MKKDVDLRACDDRLCNACFEEDEKALAALRTDKSFATTNTLTVRAAGAGKSDSPTTRIVTAGAGTSGVSGGVNVLPNVFSKDRVVSTDVGCLQPVAPLMGCYSRLCQSPAVLFLIV